MTIMTTSSFGSRGLALVLGIVASACGGVDADTAAVLAGPYNGEIVLRHQDPLKAIFAATSVVVAAGGSLAGGTLTTTAPTPVIGEVGAVSGSVVSSGGIDAEATMTLAFPTLGTFTAEGVLVYAATTRELAGVLTARGSSGAVVGTVLVTMRR